MESLELLQRQIKTAESLQSLVKTMKALAASSISHYERSVEALADYSRAIEMGLQIVLRHRRPSQPIEKPHAEEDFAGIVFGSDQGMCGSLNDQIVEHLLQTVEEQGLKPEASLFLAVGQRAAGIMETRGLQVEHVSAVPVSTAGISPAVAEIVLKIEEWHERRGFQRIMVFHHRPAGRASFRPHKLVLFPIDRRWLHEIEERPWPSHCLPSFTMEWNNLFSALIREHLFVALYRAFAESLASENASRLAAMQVAEQNIEDRMKTLLVDFHQSRQMSVTSELLDIVGGFEALSG